jgi:hypothetical protein
MSFIERTGICTCCPGHILAQLARRRSVRALAVIALAVDIFAAFGAF